MTKKREDERQVIVSSPARRPYGTDRRRPSCLSEAMKMFFFDKDKIAEFCRRNQIWRLALFGSALRDDFTPESDVDVLVEFDPKARVGFFELFDMEQELSILLGGRKIDMNTTKSLSKHFREEVLQEAEPLYVAT